MPDTPSVPSIPELARRICENCRFWDNSTTLEHRDESGLCRKNPPSAHPLIGRAFWPFTDDTDWCGAFQQQEAQP